MYTLYKRGVEDLCTGALVIINRLHADDTELHVSSKHQSQQMTDFSLIMLPECLKSITTWMLSSFFLLNYDKTNVLLHGLQAARSKQKFLMTIMCRPSKHI